MMPGRRGTLPEGRRERSVRELLHPGTNLRGGKAIDLERGREGFPNFVAAGAIGWHDAMAIIQVVARRVNLVLGKAGITGMNEDRDGCACRSSVLLSALLIQPAS